MKTPEFDYLYLTGWNEENPSQNIGLRSAEHEKIGVFLDVRELVSGSTFI
jgi:hypothetical protein